MPGVENGKRTEARARGMLTLAAFLLQVRSGAQPREALEHAYLRVALQQRVDNGRNDLILAHKLRALHTQTNARSSRDAAYADALGVVAGAFQDLEDGYVKTPGDFGAKAYVLGVLRREVSLIGVDFDENSVYANFVKPSRRNR
jgi:hypothetical protein